MLYAVLLIGALRDSDSDDVPSSDLLDVQYGDVSATLSDEASWMNVIAANYDVETLSNLADQACQSSMESVHTNDEADLATCRQSTRRPKQAAVHVDHGYANLLGTTALKKTKKRIVRINKEASTASVNNIDSECKTQEKSRQSCFAVDLVQQVMRQILPAENGKQTVVSSRMNKNVMAECEQIDKNADLEVRRALDKRDLTQFVETLFSCTSIRSAIIRKFMLRANAASAGLKRRKHGFVSILMRKDINDMVNFSWERVFMEAFSQQSDLVHVLLASMMKGIKVDSAQSVRKVVVKVALIYAIVSNQYNPELSCVQRLLATILHDNCCDKKVS